MDRRFFQRHYSVHSTHSFVVGNQIATSARINQLSHTHIIDGAGFCTACGKEVKPVDENSFTSVVAATTARAFKVKAGKVEYVVITRSVTEAQEGEEYSEYMAWDTIEYVLGSNGVYRKFLKNGIKPIVELDYLPDALADRSGDVTQEGTGEKYNNRFYPNDLEKWKKLLTAFMQNLVDEFGLEELRTWYFEVWNEPDSLPIGSWNLF